jgi:hypothetical protein
MGPMGQYGPPWAKGARELDLCRVSPFWRPVMTECKPKLKSTSTPNMYIYICIYIYIYTYSQQPAPSSSSSSSNSGVVVVAVVVRVVVAVAVDIAIVFYFKAVIPNRVPWSPMCAFNAHMGCVPQKLHQGAWKVEVASILWLIFFSRLDRRWCALRLSPAPSTW